MELRVCKHCFDGEHGDDHKTALVRDMVACAERIDEYRELISLEGVYVTKVEEGEVEGAKALPAFVATMNQDRVQVTDTQLVMEDPEGNLLVYPDHGDILEILTGNIEEIAEEAPEDVTVELSDETVDLLSI